jgi:O-acetyl-ADP-ribose deacetylase (regulator of RNase III)
MLRPNNETKIRIISGDITKVKADVIVNAANPSLLGGGGVDGAIHLAAGQELYEECKALGSCKTGQAKITKGYNLPAKFVIHTVGPIYGHERGREAELSAGCYRSCLDLAKRFKLKTMAFSSISTGAFGYPKDEAAEIAIKTVNAFVAANPDCFSEIFFVLYDELNYKIYASLMNEKEPDFF